MHVEFRQPRDGAHDIRRFVHHNHGGGPQTRFDRDQAVEIHQHGVAHRSRDHRHRGATGDHRQQAVPAAAHAARVLVDEILQGDAHLLLDGAGVVHMARDAEQLGAGILRPAEAGEPRRAAAHDFGNRRHRFDVVDGGRAAVKAGIGREWRLEARHALAALEAVDQRRFLAADVGAGAAVDVDVEIPARTAGVLAEQPRLAGFFDGGLDAVAFVVELAAYIDVTGVGAHGEAADQAAFQKLVRLVAQDLAVLAGARLAFVGVDHQIMRASVVHLRHERPFEAGEEAGAAAPAHPRFLDLVHDPLAALCQDRLGAVPVAACPRALEPPIVQAVEVREDAVLVAQHHSPRRAGTSVRLVGPPAGSQPLRPDCGPGFISRPALSVIKSFSADCGSRSS